VTREKHPMIGEGSSSENETKSAEIKVCTLSSDMSASLSATSPGYDVLWLGDSRPDLSRVVREFVQMALVDGGSVSVMGSGPASMGTSLRSAIATVNDGARVWRGEEKFDVYLYWDDRMD
jgi:ferric-chelate reductase